MPEEQVQEQMQEQEHAPKTFYRPARLEDFLDEGDVIINKSDHNKNQSHNDKNYVEKNQQEFGHKKRIKP
jgi:hypothetical protein